MHLPEVQDTLLPPQQKPLLGSQASPMAANFWHGGGPGYGLTHLLLVQEILLPPQHFPAFKSQ